MCDLSLNVSDNAAGEIAVPYLESNVYIRKIFSSFYSEGITIVPPGAVQIQDLFKA